MFANTSTEEFFQILDKVIDKFGTLKYIYSNKPDFIKGIDTIYYSGPYWDKNEIYAIFESILSGKWLSSGEKVAEFEKSDLF